MRFDNESNIKPGTKKENDVFFGIGVFGLTEVNIFELSKISLIMLKLASV